MKPVSRIIALEEAFLHPKMWDLFPDGLKQRFRLVKSKLVDVGLERLRAMDAAGIDLQVLSHVAPGAQFLSDAELSVRLCREVNEYLAEAIAAHPARFAGFAMLPTQSPEDAARELERTVVEYGFKGALINGHTNGRYLDDPSYSVLFARAEALDVPIYLHPTDPPEPVLNAYYSGYPALVVGWGFLVETGTHLLRLMAGGVFDRHPQLKIIVGHMGELIPYTMTRLEQSLTFGEWLITAEAVRATGSNPKSARMEKTVSYYMKHNVFITTSGVFDEPVFECAKAVVSLDNILFSVDYPLRDNVEAVDFLRRIRLPQADKEKIGHSNAERVLKLSDGAAAIAAPTSLASAVDRFRARIQSKLGRALVSMLVK